MDGLQATRDPNTVNRHSQAKPFTYHRSRTDAFEELGSLARRGLGLDAIRELGARRVRVGRAVVLVAQRRRGRGLDTARQPRRAAVGSTVWLIGWSCC